MSKRVKPSQKVTTPPALRLIQESEKTPANDVNIITANQQNSDSIEQQLIMPANNQLAESAFDESSTTPYQHTVLSSLPAIQQNSNTVDDVNIITANTENSIQSKQQLTISAIDENIKKANTVLPSVSAPRSRRRKNDLEKVDTGKAHLTADIDKNLHKRLKLTAVHFDVDMVNLIEPAIRLYLDLLQDSYAFKTMQTESNFSAALINALKAEK